MFNDDASRNRAELEPIDYLTRSTTPRGGLVAIALGVLAIAVAIWLSVGSIDHSLWLTGKLLDAPATDAEDNGAPKGLTRLETEVRLADAQALSLGGRIFVFRNDSAGTFLSGNIRGVHFLEPHSGRPTATLRLDIERDPSSVYLPPSPGEDLRLRIPIGSQRPIELLLGFANPGRARGP
ncbi:MAG: hypothetical protein OXH09_12910 [Gammaproteobacteria bacterium]|nr:hypothetical protein [Gammaproteobacteria bacterium]